MCVCGLVCVSLYAWARPTLRPPTPTTLHPPPPKTHTPPTHTHKPHKIESKYETLELRVVHRRRRTGFEDTKELALCKNDLIAGRYQVGGCFLRARGARGVRGVRA